MKHVLENVKKSDVVTDPFPYIVIDNAVDEDIVEELISQYPDTSVVGEGESLGDNKRFSLGAPKVAESDGVSDVWKQFIEANSSQAFLDKFIELFGDHIPKYFPDFEEKFGPVNKLRAGVRNKDQHQKGQILLDAQIAVNTPVIKKPSSVKIAHVDNSNKLFSGLFYLRPDIDDSVGGSLQIYKYKDSNKIQFHDARLVENKYVDVIKTIPYKKNTLVLFLNTMYSLHGVTVREQTDHPRIFMNLIGETPEDLFSLSKNYEGFIYNKLRRIIKKIN